MLYTNFFCELQNKEFKEYKDVIEYLDEYQRHEILSDPQYILNRLKYLQTINSYDFDQLYHQPPHSDTVISAINAVNQYYHGSQDDSVSLFPLSFSDGSGSFAPYAGIKNAVENELNTYAFHRYSEASLSLQTLDILNRWAIQQGFNMHEHNNQSHNWQIYAGGTTRACAEIFKLFTKNDVILFPTPTYGNLIALAAQYATVKLIPLSEKQWKITPEILYQYLNPCDKHLLVFVNPTNPTGQIYTQTEINALAEIMHQYNCWVVDDIVHSGLTLDNNIRQGFFQASCVSQHTFTVMGPSKTHGAAGWRLGILHVNDIHYAQQLKRNATLTEFNHCKIYEAMIDTCYAITDDVEHYIQHNNLEYQLRHALLKLFIYGESVAQELTHGEALVQYIYKIFPHKAAAFLTPAHGLSLLTNPKASFFQLLDFGTWKNKHAGSLKITTSFDIYQLLAAVNIMVLPDLAQGFHDDLHLCVRISVSHSYLPLLDIKHKPDVARNMVAHYLLGCALERIKMLAPLLS